MILQALTAYYEQLVRQGKLSAPGWDDSFKVSYELRLNDAGQLLRVVPLLTEKTVGKKTVLAPRAMRVPAHEKRSSGFAANFLCDNSTYLLGADEKGKMAVRELIVFKHDSELGNAPAYKLFDAVTVEHKAEMVAPRSYQDYTVTVADTLPEGVHCERFH